MLFPNHPAFRRFQEMTETPHRVFFVDESELNRWLKSIKWNPVYIGAYDEGSYREWIKTATSKYIRLTEPIFDEEGQLKVYSEDKWQDSWLQLGIDLSSLQEAQFKPE